jgi:hypothetical protein
VKGAHRVGPALAENAIESLSAFRLKQRILCVRLGRIDIAIGFRALTTPTKRAGSEALVNVVDVKGSDLL